jgi:hypothetical protein
MKCSGHSRTSDVDAVFVIGLENGEVSEQDADAGVSERLLEAIGREMKADVRCRHRPDSECEPSYAFLAELPVDIEGVSSWHSERTMARRLPSGSDTTATGGAGRRASAREQGEEMQHGNLGLVMLEERKAIPCNWRPPTAEGSPRNSDAHTWRGVVMRDPGDLDDRLFLVRDPAEGDTYRPEQLVGRPAYRPRLSQGVAGLLARGRMVRRDGVDVSKMCREPERRTRRSQ